MNPRLEGNGRTNGKVFKVEGLAFGRSLEEYSWFMQEAERSVLRQSEQGEES